MYLQRLLCVHLGFASSLSTSFELSIPAAGDEDGWCLGGLRNGYACCPAECGVCGGEGCALRPVTPPASRLFDSLPLVIRVFTLAW